MRFILIILSFFSFSVLIIGQEEGQLLFEEIELRSEISLTNITSINKDADGNLWITSLEGLYKYDGYDIIKYVSDENSNHGLVRDITRNTHLAPDGTFWIVGAFSIYRYDPESERLIRVTEHNRNNYRGLYELGYFDVEDIDDEHLAVGTKAGLLVYNKETEMVIKHDSLVIDYKDDRFSTNAHIRLIERDPAHKNTLWLLAKTGLYSFDCELQTTFLEYEFDPENIRPNNSHRGYWMVVKEDFVYLLVGYKRLFKFDKKTKKIEEIFHRKEGPEAPGGYMRNILPAEDGFYFVSISNGIKQYRESDNKIVDLENINIYGDKFSEFSFAMQDEKDRIVFFNQGNSLITSAYNEIEKNKNQRIFTKNLKIGGFSFEDTIKNNSRHILETYQRNVEFDIGLTNRDFKDQEEYFYKIGESKKEWSLLKENHIELKDLTAGKHEVFVKILSNGEPIESRVKSLEVKPFFYETTWFLILIGLGLVGVASIISYLINIRKKDQKEYQEKMFELEMNALRSQMNPHFLFNSINSIKSYVISKDKDQAAEYLTQFAKLIRMILENSRKRYLTVEEEVEMLKLYIIMEQKRLSFSFDFDIQVDDNIDHNLLIAPMLIQPYVENAIWHGLMNKYGTDKKLLIKLCLANDGIEIIIKDNGIGRIASQKINAENKTSKKSLGLKITEDRISIIKEMYQIDASIEVEDLYDDNGSPIGTRVIIYLPEIHQITINDQSNNLRR